MVFDWFILSMCIQVILDSSFARPGSAPKGREERRVQGLDYPKGCIIFITFNSTLSLRGEDFGQDMPQKIINAYNNLWQLQIPTS